MNFGDALLVTTLVTAPPAFEATLGPGGQVVIVRSADDARDHHPFHRHHPHAPGTRLVAATTVSSTSGHVLLALPDLDHVKDAASDQIIEHLKPFYATAASLFAQRR